MYVTAGVGICGYFASALRNAYLQRPLSTGIHRHVFWTGLGLCVGYVVENWMDDRYAERDRVMTDYMRRHPDDFPTAERKKWAEVTWRWEPAR